MIIRFYDLFHFPCGGEGFIDIADDGSELQGGENIYSNFLPVTSYFSLFRIIITWLFSMIL